MGSEAGISETHAVDPIVELIFSLAIPTKPSCTAELSTADPL